MAVSTRGKCWEVGPARRSPAVMLSVWILLAVPQDRKRLPEVLQLTRGAAALLQPHREWVLWGHSHYRPEPHERGEPSGTVCGNPLCSSVCSCSPPCSPLLPRLPSARNQAARRRSSTCPCWSLPTCPAPGLPAIRRS